MERNNDTNMVSTVNKALQILQCFTIERPERKVTEIANSLGMNKSNVSRLLTTLASQGFVVKDPDTQKYRLGLALIPLYAVVTTSLEVRREAEPLLQNLVNELGETANITVFQENSIIDIMRINSKQPVQIISHIEVLNPLHCTSAGKVFLAYQKDDYLTKYFDEGGIELSNKFYKSCEDFKEMLKKVREQGYAISFEELLEGVATIAAPIRDYTGKVAYSVSVLGPVHRFQPDSISVINKVKKCALEISRSLGYRY